jgi:L-lysine exporter family protein LysE/ArgO
MFSTFFTGFFLGLSLIVAIGAQNAFVLRQGIIGQHVFYVALFCAVSDALLICIGVAGISFLMSNFVNQISSWLFGFCALWISGYGVCKLKDVYKGHSILNLQTSSAKNLSSTLSTLAIFTFANPHVYLDTMILIGSISQQFSGFNKLSFALGASIASFVFFYGLAYGAKFLTPLMRSSNSWRILDSIIALIMFFIALKLAYAGEWL